MKAAPGECWEFQRKRQYILERARLEAQLACQQYALHMAQQVIWQTSPAIQPIDASCLTGEHLGNLCKSSGDIVIKNAAGLSEMIHHLAQMFVICMQCTLYRIAQTNGLDVAATYVLFVCAVMTSFSL